MQFGSPNAKMETAKEVTVCNSEYVPYSDNVKYRDRIIDTIIDSSKLITLLADKANAEPPTLPCLFFKAIFPQNIFKKFS